VFKPFKNKKEVRKYYIRNEIRATLQTVKMEQIIMNRKQEKRHAAEARRLLLKGDEKENMCELASVRARKLDTTDQSDER